MAAKNLFVLGLVIFLTNNSVCASKKDNIFSPRIIGGEDAPSGRFPYYSSLYRGNFVSQNSFVCGASLIAPDFVITAAHCDQRTLSVAVDNTRLFGNGERRSVKRKFKHPQYNTASIENDIMLLQLDSAVANDINPVKLNFNANLPNENDGKTEKLYAIGLGETGTGRLPQTLQFVDVPEVPFEECEGYYGLQGVGGFLDDLFNGFFDTMETSKQICAGGIVGKDSCSGDSGGPLIINKESSEPSDDILLGITSYGKGCAQDVPAVYTRISGYETWIKDHVCRYSQSSPDYCDGYESMIPDISDDSDDGDNSGGGGGFFNMFGGFCFSGEDLVETEQGEILSMKELKIGDSILVEKGENKKFEQVYSFGHRSDSIKTDFLNIQTKNGAKLEVTKDHLIFVEGGKVVPAGQLQQQQKTKLIYNGTLVGIESITTITRDGMYAPFTPSGKLVVNGFQVSSFVAINGSSTIKVLGMNLHYQMLSKSFESPRRMICNYIYGTCDGRESYDAKSGISTWHRVALTAYQWLLEQNTIIFNFGFIITFIAVTLIGTLESIITFVIAPLWSLLVIGTIIMVTCFRKGSFHSMKTLNK